MDVVRVKFPAGFKIDELPDPVLLETSFGRYSASYKVTDGQLTSDRTLILQSTTLPPEQYAVVRDFFRKIIAAEQAAVVLVIIGSIATRHRSREATVICVKATTEPTPKH